MAVMSQTYRYPPSVAAGSTPPTATVMRNYSKVVIDVACGAQATNDATALVHNMALSADGLDASPEITIQRIVGGSASQPSIVVVTDANTVTISQANAAANANFTDRVTISRPHTLTR
jgi:hypothetical protein